MTGRRSATEFTGDVDGVAGLCSAPVDADALTYVPPVNGETTIEFPGDPPIADGSGSRIGPYVLLQKIGEGGMGAVYLAEQETPVRRRVAIKIIKPGLDSEQFIARFEAERQTLALMDHPNIAKVLEAGATDTGSPYFVMELVRGVSITAYCDQARLTLRERLELFVPVCQAIQHAHQKGIIHRDIKPSNVLVTVTDGKPSAKVIDFGVARTIDQRLSEETLVVQFGAVIGTLEYMSPEQAETRGLDIDTRSDIYSLGILLYELLTGSTPIQCRKLPDVAFTEILRRIREEEPPKPSIRLSATEELATIAANRKIEPARLSRSGPRRARLDRDEGAREGSLPAVRDGQRPGPRHRALPGRRSGRGRLAIDDVPTGEVRAKVSGAAPDRGGFPGAAGPGRRPRYLPGASRLTG